MRILDRYILTQMLRPLAVTLLIALLVLLIERMLRVLDIVLDSNGTMRVVFELLAYLLPHYLGVALPMAFFLSVFLVFNKLSKDSELDALFNVGFSLTRLVRPLMISAFVLTLLAGFIFDTLQPHSRYAYRILFNAITNASLQALIQEGVFISIGDTTFLVNKLGADRRSLGDVFVYRAPSGRESSAVTARSGVLDTIGPTDQPQPAIRLFDGVEITAPNDPFTPQPGLNNGSTVREGSLRFAELRTTLSNNAYEALRPRGRDERELTLAELWAQRNDPPPGVASGRIIAEFHERIVRVLSVLAMPLLAVPLALGRRRSYRSYGIAIGALILVVFDQVLQTGAKMVGREQLSPLLGIWGPYFFFLGLSAWLFLRAAYRVPRHHGFVWLDWMTGLFRRRRQTPAGA
mgnify:CR=1 FL=1